MIRFETAVVAEIHKLAATLSTPQALYHWRSHGGAELQLLWGGGRAGEITGASAGGPTPVR